MIINRETTCRACGKKIMFLKTHNGKTVPVDAESVYFVPDIRGKNLYVLPDGGTLRGVEPMEGDQDKHIGYISHFATCPNADQFRKPRKKDRKGAGR